MFELLEKIAERPEPYSEYTAADLWTDPHTSEQMLAFHLNPDIDVSSRNAAFIDRSVDWIARRFGVGPETRIIDFGCGPGLYTARLAGRGAQVTGIDFSARSVAYATQEAARQGLDIRYVNQDYLTFETGERFDLILMIMCDFCALSPAQRGAMLAKFRDLLAPDGRVLLDVYSLASFDRRAETAVFEKNLLSGFWSAAPYYGFLHTFKYEAEKVVLDKYAVIEPDRTRLVYNWLQHFSPEALGREFEAAGLFVEAVHANVAGADFDPDGPEFAVVAGKQPVL